MSALRDELESILKSENGTALRKFLLSLTDDQRAEIAPTAIAAYKQAFKISWSSKHVPLRLNAVLATASSAQIQKVPFVWADTSDLDLELLRKLRPPTFQTWIEGRIAARRIQYEHLIQLVKEGLCTRPDTDDFITFMMGSFRILGFNVPLVPYFKEDKEFLEHYAWRLFEVEGDSENNLAGQDKYCAPDRTWEYLLVELSRSGDLPRERLLDCSLQALDRGFGQFRSGWHSRFHEALKPTIEERIARTDMYAHLLGSSIPPTVSLALDALVVIDKASPLQSEVLLQHIEPVLSSKSKSTVKSAILLIDRAMTRDSENASALFQVAMRGLIHESPDVQKQILKLLAKVPGGIDHSLRAELAQYEPSLAPSVQGRNGSSPARLTRETYVEIKRELPSPLETNAQIVEFDTIDQVIAGCSYSLEHSADVLEVERALQGIVRFSSMLPADFAARAAALKKRASQIVKSKSESVTWLNRQFAAFVIGWITSATAPDLSRRNAVENERFMHRRLEKLLQRVIKRESLPEFCAPTHERGFIHPRVLLERWNQWQAAGCVPDEEELVIGLLRMPLGHLSELLPQYVGVPGEFWDACRYATGYSETKRGDSQIWIAADAYRNPVVPAVLLDLGTGPIWTQPSQLDFMRTLGLCYPALRNQYVASGIRRLGSMLDGSWEFDRCARAYIEPLLDPSFPFDRDSYHILACSLIVAEPSFVGIARDVLIQLVELDRLSIEQLGKELGVFIYCGRGKAKRMTASLWDVARISDKHLSAVRQLLERALQGGEIVPRDISVYLELFNELLHSEGIMLNNQETRAHLESLKTGGKAAKLVRELLGA
ncbi:MAG: DUF6493 family protein [Candidatus Obscuribacterales bacterium]